MEINWGTMPKAGHCSLLAYTCLQTRLHISLMLTCLQIQMHCGSLQFRWGKGCSHRWYHVLSVDLAGEKRISAAGWWKLEWRSAHPLGEGKGAITSGPLAHKERGQGHYISKRLELSGLGDSSVVAVFATQGWGPESRTHVKNTG